MQLVQYVTSEIFVSCRHISYIDMHSGQNLLSCMPKYISLNKNFVSKIIFALKGKKKNFSHVQGDCLSGKKKLFFNVGVLLHAKKHTQNLRPLLNWPPD